MFPIIRPLTFILGFSACLGIAQAQSNRPRGRSSQVVVSVLGVKIETVQFTADNEQAARSRADLKKNNMCSPCEAPRLDGVRVIAVQENGAAFYAGIVPGDIITHFGGWNNLAADQVASAVATNYRPGQGMDLTVFYSVQGSPYPRWTSVSLTVSGPGQGRWISDVPVHTGTARGTLPGVREARSDVKQRYDEQKKKAMQAILSDPCNIDQAEVKRMAAELGALAASARIGDQGDEFMLQGARASACQNARDGGLPAFESALWAMTDARKLDPCTYSPKADYNHVFNEAAYQAFNTKSAYDSGSKRRFELYVGRANDQRRACFLDLIVAKLTEQDWRPRETPPESRTPNAPVTNDAGSGGRQTESSAKAPAQVMGSSGTVPSRTLAPPTSQLPVQPPHTALSATPVQNLPSSGKLTYSGPPVPQNGEVVFNNLPEGPLTFVYDTKAWTHRVAPGPNGTQRVILTSKRSGMQTRLEVQWSRVHIEGR